MIDLTVPRPIVDPLGSFVFVPLALAKTEPDAVRIARDTDPGHEIYQPVGKEAWKIRPVQPDDEDDAFLIDEYGAQTVAEPAGDGEGGDLYWVIALALDVIPSGLNLELHDADEQADCMGQWCCGCKAHPIGKPWGWNHEAWDRHRACQHPDRDG